MEKTIGLNMIKKMNVMLHLPEDDRIFNTCEEEMCQDVKLKESLPQVC